MSRRSSARLRTLFDVQRRGDIGSPDAVGSTSPSRSRSNVGSLSRRGRRPPPGRRTRPGSAVSPASSSFNPRAMVDTEMPVARETRTIPPRPAAFASVAAQMRRARSSSSAASALYFALRVPSSTHPISALFRKRFSYSWTPPKGTISSQRGSSKSNIPAPHMAILTHSRECPHLQVLAQQCDQI